MFVYTKIYIYMHKYLQENLKNYNVKKQERSFIYSVNINNKNKMRMNPKFIINSFLENDDEKDINTQNLFFLFFFSFFALNFPKPNKKKNSVQKSAKKYQTKNNRKKKG